MRQTRVRLSALDEAILDWQEATGPWNVLVEVATGGRLDAEAVRASLEHVLRAHLLTRCAVHSAANGARWWTPTGQVALAPVPLADASTSAAHDTALAELVSVPLEPSAPPLVRAAVLRGATEDHLALSVSHVLCDGIGGLRLLEGLTADLRGVPDRIDHPTVELARRVLARRPAAGLDGLARRWSANAQLAAAGARAPSRLARVGGARTGEGVVRRSLPAADVRQAAAGRSASVGDLLVVAAHLAVDRWNRAAGEDARVVGVAEAVNLRAPAWRNDVVANLASFASTRTDEADRATGANVLDVVRRQRTAEARLLGARAAVDAARLAAATPRSARRRLFDAVVAGALDSFVVSNYGVLDDPPRCGDDPRAVRVTQAPVPGVGAGVSIVGVEDVVNVTLRYRTELLDRRAAGELIDCYLEALTER